MARSLHLRELSCFRRFALERNQGTYDLIGGHQFYIHHTSYGSFYSRAIDVELYAQAAWSMAKLHAYARTGPYTYLYTTVVIQGSNSAPREHGILAPYRLKPFHDHLARVLLRHGGRSVTKISLGVVSIVGKGAVGVARRERKPPAGAT